jgi:hypothetical protein
VGAPEAAGKGGGGVSNEVFAFEVSVKGREWSRIVNARSPGKAKVEYFRDVCESWPEIPFTAIRCRKVGAPISSAQFLNNARYRGLPNIRCGDRVKVGKEQGAIVGHDASANFLVLFDEDSKYAGNTLSVHPEGMEASA